MNMKSEVAMEIAHNAIMGEFDDLHYDPNDYIASMGMDPSVFKDVDWNDVDWSERDTERLAKAIMQAFRHSPESEVSEKILDALYDDKVQDTLHDIMANAINRMR